MGGRGGAALLTGIISAASYLHLPGEEMWGGSEAAQHRSKLPASLRLWCLPLVSPQPATATRAPRKPKLAETPAVQMLPAIMLPVKQEAIIS